MTQQEIQERNKQIALMFGAIYSIHAEAWGFGNARIEPNELKFGNKIIKGAIWAERFEKELKFHSDWNWLMEAVEFIETQNMEVSIIQNECSIIDTEKAELEENPFMIEPVAKCFEVSTKKEAVFLAVSDFAKLYNNEEI